MSGLLAMFLVLSACVFIYAETGDSLRKGAAAGAVAPAQVYRSSCIRCHDEDGRGGCGRSFYKSIPDFTDNRWQGSRDDDEIGRTIVHGKAPMAPMGKKLKGLDVKEMVSFVRSFRGGGLRVVVDDSTSEAEKKPSSKKRERSPAVPDAHADGGIKASSAAATHALAPVRFAANASEAATDGKRSSSEKAKRDEAVALFRKNCLSCHEADGRGQAQRETIPSLPDFSSRLWQASRDDSRIAASILDGKGRIMPPWREHLSPDQVRQLVAFVRSLGPSALIGAGHGLSSTEFANRFRALQLRWDELSRQARTLTEPRTEDSRAPRDRYAR